jgi:hypothetical protein
LGEEAINENVSKDERSDAYLGAMELSSISWVPFPVTQSTIHLASNLSSIVPTNSGGYYSVRIWRPECAEVPARQECRDAVFGIKPI